MALCMIRGVHTMTLWTAKDILRVCAGWKRQNEADDNPAKPDDARHPHHRPSPISPQVSANVVGFEGVGVLGETDFLQPIPAALMLRPLRTGGGVVNSGASD